jgi:hypothetical protein
MSNLTTSTKVEAGKNVSIALPPPHDEFTKLAFGKFSELDSDDDGFISKDDVNRALQDPTFTGADAAMIATLKVTLGDLQSLSDDEFGWENDGVTRADLTAYDRLRERNSDHKTVKTVAARFKKSKTKIAARSNNLFDGVPDVNSIKQGTIGNCWFLAALVAVGHRNVSDIKKMVKQGDLADEFVVTLPGVAKKITTLKPTDAELAIFALSNGLWLPVIEKSYGAAVNKDALFFVNSSDIDALDGGDFLPKGIRVMTGSSVDTDILSLTRKDTTRSKIKSAFANKKIVTANVRPEVLGASRRDNGLPMGHAYTVLGYDEEKDAVELRNPWGHDGMPFKGRFIQTISELDENFTGVAYEE